MGYYTIKDLQKLSGVKAHTIRVWEQRYKLLHPERTDTNIRRYSDKDLKILLNVAILNKYGLKISHICSMSEPEIKKRVLDTCQSVNDFNSDVDRLLVELIEFDEVGFKQVLYQCIDELGVKTCFEKVVYPFLQKIGILWQIGNINPAEEHLMSNVVRAVLIHETEKLKVTPNSDAKSFLLFLPENEWHEIGLLLYNYVLKNRGEKVYYLGASVPKQDMALAIQKINPDFTFSCYVNTLRTKELESFLIDLSIDFPKIEHLVTGYQVIEGNISVNNNVTIIKTIAEL